MTPGERRSGRYRESRDLEKSRYRGSYEAVFSGEALSWGFLKVFGVQR